MQVVDRLRGCHIRNPESSPGATELRVENVLGGDNDPESGSVEESVEAVGPAGGRGVEAVRTDEIVVRATIAFRIEGKSVDLSPVSERQTDFNFD